MGAPSLNFEAAVLRVYGDGARRDIGLCCPVDYDQQLLTIIPNDVLERDYGCGDPTRHVAAGETVLDLGSGSGKSVYIMSQVVGREGRVIGVDMNDEMLALARGAQVQFQANGGPDNVRFGKARIQDLRLDLELADKFLAEHPVRTMADLAAAEAHFADLRTRAPLVADESVDVVVSDCVLNLVRPSDKVMLFQEIHRVLRPGGRAVISDIVCDEDVPDRLQQDPELWAGCVSGAMREDHFLQAFEAVGLYGIEVVARTAEPWQTVEGIEFRSVTVIAYKGKEGACLDGKQAVIYRGPFKEVRDDDGHVFPRGVRLAVCRKTFNLYAKPPYRQHVDLVEPRVAVPEAELRPFPCGDAMLVRAPRETKGEGYRETIEAVSACGTSGACC